MPYFENDGNRLYYEDSGGDGPAILFSHGAFLDHTIWELVVSALSPSYRCLTWDERGHGMSESNGPFSYWDAARDAVVLLDTAGVDRAVLVGMSQGGWLSQRAALASPDRVAGLVLTGTSVRLMADAELEGYRQISQGWLAMGPVDDIAAAVLGIQFAPSDYDGSRFIERWQSKPPSTWADAWQAILSRDDILDRFSDIACPALVVHATTDPAFTLDAAREMSDLLPGSRGLVAVESGTHCMALTHPKTFTEEIRGFAAALEY